MLQKKAERKERKRKKSIYSTQPSAIQVCGISAAALSSTSSRSGDCMCIQMFVILSGSIILITTLSSAPATAIAVAFVATKYAYLCVVGVSVNISF